MGILGAGNHIAREIKLTFPYLYQHSFQQGKIIQLGYETVGTGLQATHHNMMGGLCRQYYHLDISIHLFQSFDHLNAVQPGNPDIQNDYIRLMFSRHRNCINTIINFGNNMMIILLQQDIYSHSDGGMIIYYQYFCHILSCHYSI